MTTIKESRAYLYAKECVKKSNKKVGIYIKKQAADWVKIVDGDNGEAYVCEKTYAKICKLLKIIIHPDLHCSMYKGLEDYAMFLIIATFCTKFSPDKTRYYQTVLLEIARKNFKTFVSAVIFIIGLLTEPKFSRFFSVAPDLKLSKELQGALRKIIKSSPALADSSVFKTLRSEIRCLLTDSEYTPLAYSEDKMDGKLANMFLADEAGAMDCYPIEAMRSSQITLFNKLGIIISTQYPNYDNALIDEIDISKKVLDGLIDNKRRFSLLFEPDIEYMSGDKWQTEDNVIYQANPVAYAHEYIFNALKDMRSLAVLYENKRENFLCKHCNIKYKSLGVEGFIEITKVRECKIVEDLSFWRGKRVYLGVDLSQTDDNTAVAMVTYFKGKIYAKVWGFIPADSVELKSKKEDVDYKKLIREGACFACGDSVIDYGFIESFVLELPKKYGVEIIQLGYDRYNAMSSVQKWENADEPVECVEIQQHSKVLHVPTKLLKEYVLKKSFQYDENLMIEINFQNARCTDDTNLNKYVNKKKSAGKVDMVVAIINAVFLLNVNEILNDQSGFGAQVV
ncbi:MAG TPA: terminase large subunit [Oscillospiraceae bacterium]|nr:terminase large subunit [Oscillospiraceae bacterium]